MRRLGAVMALVLLAAACGQQDDTLTGFVREPLPNVADTSLPDVSRSASDFPMRAVDGEVLLVYFGYTSCPDVCPTTLADIRTALGKLAAGEADKVSLAMATIDPTRDTDDVITGYVQTFVPDAHALRTTDDELLRSVTDAFGASYGVTITEDGEYEVSHTGQLYAIDAAGHLLVTWPFGITPDDLAHDIEILLRQA